MQVPTAAKLPWLAMRMQATADHPRTPLDRYSRSWRSWTRRLRCRRRRGRPQGRQARRRPRRLRPAQQQLLMTTMTTPSSQMQTPSGVDGHFICRQHLDWHAAASMSWKMRMLCRHAGGPRRSASGSEGRTWRRTTSRWAAWAVSPAWGLPALTTPAWQPAKVSTPVPLEDACHSPSLSPPP
jgi:hypothetical protein